jgi:choline-glycine betaine transporter
MNNKIVSTILVACASLLALFFVIKQNFELAVLFLTIMFTFSNFFRSRSFKEQGYEKESKWMKSMAIFFGICSILILIVIIK